MPPDLTLLTPPPIDDRPIWDLWLSQYHLPLVVIGDELGLFGRLAAAPATRAEVATELALPARSAEALLTALAALDLLVPTSDGTAGPRYALTELARLYLLPESPFYWVPMLRGMAVSPAAAALLANLRTENLGSDDRVTRRWERGEMSAEDARGGNERMHSHSLPAAMGLARTLDLQGVSRLLDVAGGSGVFAIQLALHHPTLRCTIAELPIVAPDTQTYIDRFGVGDRVDVHPFNMFDDPWPRGYDAIFFSNVFHDWDAGRRADLAAAAFAALPPGGRILLHEMLLDEVGAGPRPAALFSVMMLGTRGKQFAPSELADLLGGVGFVDTRATPTYGYYAVVSATRPA